MISKKALLTGITGQDGSYLAELLLSKNYEVHGIIRRCSNFNTQRIDHIYKDLHLHYGDVTDFGCLFQVISEIQPDEIYNLAAQSHVRVSFDSPIYTSEVDAIGVLNLLEIVKRFKCKMYQASTSEMFGNEPSPQSESTKFDVRSPYAAAKVYAHNLCGLYREAYGLFISCGILFNHESSCRGETFVTRKITKAIANIKAGKQKELLLGNLDSYRDWGYAPDYVDAMYLMLQQDEPDDFVIATGETHSIRDFLDEAFEYAGLDWHDYVRIDPKYYRPAEVDYLCGDASKAKDKLGWKPKTKFKELVRLMVDGDINCHGDK